MKIWLDVIETQFMNGSVINKAQWKNEIIWIFCTTK